MIQTRQIVIFRFDFSSGKHLPVSSTMKNNRCIKGRTYKTYRNLSFEWKLPNGETHVEIVFLPGDHKKDWSHVCGTLEIVFGKVKLEGLKHGVVYSSFLIICDGSSSETES